MKGVKFLNLLTIAVCFSSCLSSVGIEEEAESNTQTTVMEAFKDSFTKKYGKPSSTQDWGYNTNFSTLSTRSSNPNSNLWGDNYLMPEPITNAEIQTVVKAFQNASGTIGEKLHWTDFFVQQVYKGTSLYKDGNGSTVQGSNQMNHLRDGKEDHINNFNNGNGAIMLMENGSTASFSNHNSTDSQYHDKYLILKVGDAYYLGFDFEANGEWPNQQVSGDGIYTDWIVKLTMATRKDAKRVICEDLGTTGDFDFNDIVVDVAPVRSWWPGDYTTVTLLAAGGRLPANLILGSQNLGETHHLFGVSDGVMVNTGAGEEKPAVQLYLDGYYEAKDLRIMVTGDDKKETTISKPKLGEVPAMICVPTTYQWTAERQDVSVKYPKFNDYVNNKDIAWWN